MRGIACVSTRLARNEALLKTLSMAHCSWVATHRSSDISFSCVWPTCVGELFRTPSAVYVALPVSNSSMICSWDNCVACDVWRAPTEPLAPEKNVSSPYTWYGVG